MDNNSQQLFRRPEYLWGQIEGLRALILTVAQAMPKEEFRQQGLDRLEATRNAMLPRAAPEETLLAIDHLEEWLRHVTG